jgi:hypothetical protein
LAKVLKVVMVVAVVLFRLKLDVASKELSLSTLTLETQVLQRPSAL